MARLTLGRHGKQECSSSRTVRRVSDASADAERAIKGLSARTQVVLIAIAAAGSARASKLLTATKLPRWRLNRMLRRLRDRGLVVEVEREEDVVYEPTTLGRRAAMLATLDLSIGEFEPERLADLRAWDRKSPFSRSCSDDFL